MQRILNNVSTLAGFVASVLSVQESQKNDCSMSQTTCRPIREIQTNSKEISQSFVHVYKQIYLSLLDHSCSTVLALHELNSKFLIVHINIEGASARMSLADIHFFDCKMQAMSRQNPQAKLVICAGASPAVRIRSILLLGCHLILSRGVPLEKIRVAFSPLRGLPECPILDSDKQEQDDDIEVIWSMELTASSCWGALAAANSNGWLNFRRAFAEDAGELSFAECLHYAE
jgi:hypothetical protein